MMGSEGRRAMAKQGTDRGPNQDFMHLSPEDDLPEDATYRNASYLGDSPDDEEELQDLGFIVDDHDDRRITLTDGWQRLDDLDTNEPLETNRRGKIPHETALRERGAAEDRFATDYHVGNAAAEAQEADFVQTSMLDSDPDMNDGSGDFTSETLQDIHGRQVATDIYGHVNGAAPGLGTTLPQDMGRGGFDIRDNPLVQPEGQPISDRLLSDEALGERDVDEMGSDEELERLADRAVRDMDRVGDVG
jgi:hypothetical protein